MHRRATLSRALLALIVLLAACVPATAPAPTTQPPTAVPALTNVPATAAGPIPTLQTGEAFGKPMPTDIWTPGNKVGVGTAYTYDLAQGDRAAPSRVWFTLTGGAITDMLYPTVSVANVKELSLLVARAGSVERELDPAAPLTPTIEYLDPRALAYRVTTAGRDGSWTATKEVVTDPAADSLVTRWRFTGSGDATPYAYFVPHLGNSGKADKLAIKDGAVVAWDEGLGIYAVLLADPAPAQMSVGYQRNSDGLTDLADGRMDWAFDHIPGQGYPAATLKLPADKPTTLAVGFGATEAAARAAAQGSLARGFDAVAAGYIAGWQRYLGALKAPPDAGPLFWVSAMVIKTHEDKTFHGAGVASLSMPWGQCRADKDSAEQGYRYVWPRDLYHVAMAYLAVGDVAGANATLGYLDDVLQEPDGSFPQNAYLDGTPKWLSLQMDEVAAPILLAWFLQAQDRYASLVKPAADFIAANGPATPQERWEENGGYSPHSIAAQVAGLVAAADMAGEAGDTASAAQWHITAREWSRKIPDWTFTTSGPLGDGRYYLRISPDGTPNVARRIEIANGSGAHPMQSVIDVSALELVRLGVRPPGDAQVAGSLPEIDAALRVETPKGPAWYRYSFDGYGEPAPGRCAPGQGRVWPLFAGERGVYAVATGDTATARAMLAAMDAFANPGLMLPEQVYESTGTGTGSATPLAWAHAEYLILARSLQEGRVVDTPAVVVEWSKGH